MSIEVYDDKFETMETHTETLEKLGHMSFGAVSATGVVAFIEAHVGLFTLLISFGGLVLMLFFYVGSLWIKWKMMKLKEQELHEKLEAVVKQPPT